MTTHQHPGVYLSVPRSDGRAYIISLGPDATPRFRFYSDDMADSALEAGMEAFYDAGYSDDDTIYATLYRIGPDGGLVFSECFPIDGPSVR